MQVIIANTDYGPKLYDASTPEAWALSSLHILTERFKDGAIYEPDAFEDSYEYRRFLQQGRMYTDEEMASMPEDFQALQRSRRLAVRKARKDYERVTATYNEIERIVNEQDASMVTIGRGRYERQVPLAWRYLQDRNDHEYESVELENVWQPELVSVDG